MTAPQPLTVPVDGPLVTAGAPAGGPAAARVIARPAEAGDEVGFLAAVRRSAAHIAPWNPVSTDPAAFHRLLEADPTWCAYLLVDRASGGIAGKVTVNGIVRGRASTAFLGYDAYLPYAGTGRMTEGLRLVVDRCFAAEAAGGLGLHRVEVNVQPGNARSLALVRRVGFRHEGFSPRFLWMNGAWRDHERFALTVEEWSAGPPAGPARP